LRFDFEDVTANSATAVLKWEKKQIPFKIGVEVTNVVMADIRKKLQSQTGFQRQTWEQAAGFALNNGGDLNEALRWVDAAISGQFFSEQNFNNTTIKANILRKQGKNAEADALLEAYVPNMTILETHQYGRQLIAQGNKERALEVFKLNAKNNKGTWPVDYGLARGYSAMGNYKTALKHAKIAHSRVPDQPNRTALELNIKKLEQGEDIN
jgi:tetratricopeptide (TPR) repeat protein